MIESPEQLAQQESAKTSNASLYYPPTGSEQTGLYRVPTQGKGPNGEIIYDVFENGQHIKDPNDTRLRGVDINLLKEGTAPTKFQSKFNPIVGSGSSVRSEVNNMGTDIANGLSEFGINKPSEGVDNALTEFQTEMDTRREQLAQRNKEDTSAIDKSYANAEDELKLAQEDEMAKLEGRTRIGGFITQFEQKDILKAARLNRLEISSLQAQRQTALQTANRAYQDQDYQVARDQLTLAKDIEKEARDKQQQYFDNIIKYKNMSTPIIEANEAVQKYAIDSIQKYRSGFVDISAEDIPSLTLADIQARILKSKEYKTELDDQQYEGSRTVQLDDGRDVLVDKKGNIIKTIGGGSSDPIIGSDGKVIPNATPIKLTTEDKNTLIGAGFSTADITNLQKDLAVYGADKVREGMSDSQKSAVNKILNIKDKVTLDQVKTSVTQKVAQEGLKSEKTQEELAKLADEAGFSSFWQKESTEIENYLKSSRAREDYAKMLYERYKTAGLAQ